MTDGIDQTTGKFLPGNRFWEARSSHGRKPKFETAEMLMNAIEQYFEWNSANPLYKMQVISFQGVATQEPVPVMRAMTIAGMCNFIGITLQTWGEWKKSRNDFSEVQTWAETTIYQQKFEGASADLLNASIIARDLGLAEKRDHTSSDGTMSPKSVDADLAATLARKLTE